MKIGKIFALMCIFCFSLCLVPTVSAIEGQSLVSPALNVVSKNCYVAMSAVSDGDVSFDAEDFERALNLSYLSSITVTKLPERSDGILYLGNSELQNGQTVSRANIGRLNLEFLNENVNKTSFCFSTGLSTHEIECNVYALKHINSAPTVDPLRDVQTFTYKNVSLYGSLSAYDKEGDDVIFEVVKQPRNGLLKMSDDGEYVYIPTKGYTGSDSFKCVALDEYGNYSTVAEVMLKVEMQSSSLVFSDISSDKYHIAAINLAEKGVLAIQEVDGKYYFHPDTELGRLEFLVMAMKNIGVQIENQDEKTVFTDDSAIPQTLKGYVNTAVKLGIISGKIDAEGNLLLAPNDKITKAEAAVILNNMAELERPVLTPVFADSNQLPSWAREAINCLSYNKIMPNNDGYISANEYLDRDEGCYMIYMFGKIAEQ